MTFMPPFDAKSLAQRLLQGELTIDDFSRALERLTSNPGVPTGQAGIADLGGAQLDLDRERRCGYPEVVFGQGKTPEFLTKIVERLANEGVDVLVTRVNPEQAEALLSSFPRGEFKDQARVFRLSLPNALATPSNGRVAIVTAGTSDLPVALEALETARWMGAETVLVQDVGVAGPHRLPSRLREIQGADAIVVVAGMEGALPSVVGGYVDCPVIAVPTSVGYGANLGGIAALLSMLNSCAANVAVVNIDAGFKGAYVAGMIARRAARARESQETAPIP